jgi:hypothetical protein
MRLSGQGILVSAIDERTALDLEARRFGIPVLNGLIQHELPTSYRLLHQPNSVTARRVRSTAD